jgi:hypothetical protein
MTKYEGQWSNNKRNGKNGFASYSDGASYKGDFKNDSQEGQGTYRWAQGHEYTGLFKDN